MSGAPPRAANDSLLGGKFRIEREIGRGAMGVVYEARDTRLERPVAIKVMSPELLLEADQRQRFEREARIAAALTSEHAVRIHEVGEDGRGAPYLVMEYLEGRTLEAMVESGALPAVATSIGWMLEALHAIAEAHSRGLVHRDVKPANLFLAARPGRPPIVKVLDFGLAKSVDPTTGVLTTTGAVMGTPAYMAPEQIRAASDVDVRADVWSIGATLFELLTGVLPFPGESTAKMVHAILNGEPRSARALRAEVPPEIDAVIRRCLEKDRAVRFADASEVARALGETMTALGDTLALPALEPPSASRVAIAGETIPITPRPRPERTMLAARDGRSSSKRSSPIVQRATSNTRVFLVSLFAVVLLGVVAFLAWGARANQRERRATTAPIELAPAPPVVPSSSSVVETLPSAAPSNSTSPLPSPRRRQVADAGQTAPPAAARHSAHLVHSEGLDASRKARWLTRVQPALDACANPLPCRSVSIFTGSDGAWTGSHWFNTGEASNGCVKSSGELDCVTSVVIRNPPPRATACIQPSTNDNAECYVRMDFVFR